MKLKGINRKVRCIDCGFLGRRWMLDVHGNFTTDGMAYRSWGVKEMPAALRAPRLDTNEKRGGLACEKGVWSAPNVGSEQVNSIFRSRECEWYVENADLSFADHAKARHERREFQRRVLLDRLVFATVGAALVAVVTQVLPKLLG